MAVDPLHWSSALPMVLLSLRVAIREDLKTSSAMLTYGSSLQVPDDFFRGAELPKSSPIEFVKELQLQMRGLVPVPSTDHQSYRPVFVNRSQQTCSHVFVRVDRVRRPLEHPYNGPFAVIKRKDKFFVILLQNHRKETVSIDRLKAAHVLTEDAVVGEFPVATRSGRISAPVVRFQSAGSSLRGE